MGKSSGARPDEVGRYPEFALMVLDTLFDSSVVTEVSASVSDMLDASDPA